jgi:topoisomerase-4 subunit A
LKNIVSSLYAEYGRYIDSFRAIPKHIDCLKPVERRLLLSVHQVARKKFQKSAKVIGTCIGNYHPHG